MLFCLDIGNSTIVMGLYDGERLRHHWRVASDTRKMPDEYAVLLLQLFARADVRLADVEGAVLASVVPALTPTLVEVCEGALGGTPLVVGAGVRTGIRVRTDDPREVGADLVADVAAAYRLYGAPACVVDFGTATKFLALSAAGDFVGAAIAPGLHISVEALARSTARLPSVEIARPPSAIGRNTVHSMQSGLVFGFVGLVEGMVARFRAELGDDMKVIATGGLASLIAGETRAIDVVDPWLTLQGLRLIWKLNRG